MVGWDIGGVNTKVALVREGVVVAAHSHPYEIQRDPLALPSLLRALVEQIGAMPDDRHAVTMTAELSQMFRTKREGVVFVLDAVTAAFPDSGVHVYAVDGRFLSTADATLEPLAVAASNWAATAHLVAHARPNAILIDIGTTTADIIPIVDGVVVAVGATDPARLASGELVYTGALRTPVEAIVRRVPLGESVAAVSAESFALIGDVHVWRGDLATEDYSVGAPDGRPATRELSGERLARIVCADREMLDDRAIGAIADAVADAQVELIGDALRRVRDRHPQLHTAVVTGLGAFIAIRAARRLALDVSRLADAIGDDASRCAPAAAVALLLERRAEPRAAHRPARAVPNETRRRVETVFKIGGSLLGLPALLESSLDRIIHASEQSRVAIVPGGGPFADAVREADDRLGLSDDTAHWMAVLAMDQYAHLLAGMRDELALTCSARDVDRILDSGRVPVIAPYRWLRGADPLPHSWDVTSDSISAWFASELGAGRLVLVKPPSADCDDALDSYFRQALSPSVSAVVVHPDAAWAEPETESVASET